MSNNSPTPSSFFNPNNQIAHLALLPCPGAEELTKLIDKHLIAWAKEVGMDVKTFIIDTECPRFQNGERQGNR